MATESSLQSAASVQKDRESVVNDDETSRQTEVQQTPFVSDAVLLKRFISDRDANAFSQLVDRYQNLVMGVSLRQVGDRRLT